MGGVQRQIVSVAGPIVSLAAHRDLLLFCLIMKADLVSRLLFMLHIYIANLKLLYISKYCLILMKQKDETKLIRKYVKLCKITGWIIDQLLNIWPYSMKIHWSLVIDLYRLILIDWYWSFLIDIDYWSLLIDIELIDTDLSWLILITDLYWLILNWLRLIFIDWYWINWYWSLLIDIDLKLLQCPIIIFHFKVCQVTSVCRLKWFRLVSKMQVLSNRLSLSAKSTLAWIG